jgi:hypothetical protein
MADVRYEIKTGPGRLAARRKAPGGPENGLVEPAGLRRRDLPHKNRYFAAPTSAVGDFR